MITGNVGFFFVSLHLIFLFLLFFIISHNPRQKFKERNQDNELTWLNDSLYSVLSIVVKKCMN